VIRELAKQIADKYMAIAEEEVKLLGYQHRGQRSESGVCLEVQQKLVTLRAELKGLEVLLRGEELCIYAASSKVIPAAERFAKHGDKGKGKAIRDFGEGDDGLIDPEGIPF
jgi:hypothetical protein